MATGKLGTASLAAATLTTVYTVPSSIVASFTISVCNTTSSPIAIRLAESTSGTPNASEYIEYGVIIPANGILERTGRVLGAAATVVAFAAAVGVSVNINGYEE
jgi:hypothetical protein|tara:strand:- start:2239 stop:2550 length:312 start_codon:yes stop_codon:yes gene_type:complete